jgi:DNA mismatch repair ATPase MutS
MRANMEAANAKRERERLKRSVRVFTNELARLHSERQSVRRLLFTLVSTAFRKLRGKVDWEAKEVMDRAKRLAQEDSILSSFEKD